MTTASELLKNIKKAQKVINRTTKAYDALDVLFKEIAINMNLFGDVHYSRKRIIGLIDDYTDNCHLPKEDELAVHNALFGYY